MNWQSALLLTEAESLAWPSNANLCDMTGVECAKCECGLILLVGTWQMEKSMLIASEASHWGG